MDYIIDVIKEAFFQVLKSTLLRILIFKGFLIALFTVGIPLILFRVWLEIQQFFMTLILNKVTDLIASANLSPGSVSLLGFGAYLADCFRLPQCLAVFLSCLSLSSVLRMLRR